MDCPYYQDHSKGCINCQRGYSKRQQLFINNNKRDKHIRRHCNCKYTKCKSYVRLENDWGHEEGVDIKGAK